VLTKLIRETRGDIRSSIHHLQLAFNMGREGRRKSPRDKSSRWDGDIILNQMIEKGLKDEDSNLFEVYFWLV